MNIEFICEHCGKRLSVEDYLGGQQIACYHCKQPVVIPHEGERTIIEFQCLGCGMPFRVPASKAGLRTKCPKCEAVLVVPGESVPGPLMTEPGDERAPVLGEELVYEEELAAPPPPVTRRAPASRGSAARTPAARGDETAETAFYVPSSRKVGPAWIIFWVLLSVLLLGAIAMVVSRRGGDEEDFEPIRVGISYKSSLDVFEITNSTREPWTDVTMTFKSSAGDYSVHRSRIAPAETVSVHGTDFKDASGMTFKSNTVDKATLVITANLAGSRRGRVEAHWASPHSR